MIPFASIDIGTVVLAVMGGGFLTGIVALLKVRPERDAVVVTSAQGALVVQSGVLDAVREELERVSRERDYERERRLTAERRVRELERMITRGGG